MGKKSNTRWRFKTPVIQSHSQKALSVRDLWTFHKSYSYSSAHWSCHLFTNLAGVCVTHIVASLLVLKMGNGTHSSTLAWKIPWTEEPGKLQSMGSLGVGYNWATSLSLFTFMHWRRKWQPTPVFLPGESQGWGSLVGCRLWGCTESDTTEVT